MKIDLHCHTRKIKTGDASTRDVDCEKFVSQVQNAGVSIVAITNHNCFDYEQYSEFSKAANIKKIQVWPGIELDIKGEQSKGHCIIIANPQYAKEFSEKCKESINGANPDLYEMDVHTIVDTFQEFDITVIAHYGWKEPSLSEHDLEILKKELANKKPLFLEVTQLRSAGILYAHNINSFIGSDVRDWDNYCNYEFPELKMPIVDYNHFNLLVKKDEQILDTFVNQKMNEKVRIVPFEDCSISLPIYNDVNVIFGGKGTGKSAILKKLKEYFESRGNADVSYYDGQTKESEFKKMIQIENEESDFLLFGIDNCHKEFESISTWTDSSITSISKYKEWAKTKDINKFSSQFGFKDAVFTENILETSYTKILEDYEKLIDISSDFDSMHNNNLYLDIEKKELFITLFNEILQNAKNSLKNEWCKLQGLKLEKFTIEKMKNLCQTKSGVNQLPSSTGLLDTYSKCLCLYNDTSNVKKMLNKRNKFIKTKLGDLKEKGPIYNEKQVFINPKEAKNVSLKKGANYSITDLRNVYDYIVKIQKNAFNQNKGQDISELNNLMKSKGITSLRDFIGVKSRIVNQSNIEYNPSNGEQSMLLLANALVDETKNVYILDEPEMSVGHKYINDIILPRLIELSKLNKTIIVSTHDANIGVRTLPLLSVYREYLGDGKYATYIGNPFTNILINHANKDDKLIWSEKCMSTLEGGEDAFIERGEIYGK